MEKEKRKGRTLLKILITTLYLSTFTFGGGYVIVSLMKKKFVDEKHWIEQDEMLDLVAIAQSSPGPIAVNGSIAVGYKLCGIAGALVAIVGTIIPPFIIISIISYCYSAFRSNWVISEMLEGMQAGVAAVIASVTYDMGADIVKQKDDLGILIMIAAFVASYILEINVVFIVIVCGLVGVCRGQLEKRRGRGHKKTEDTSDGKTSRQRGDGIMIYLQLFLSFFQIGLFSFGGGYAAMPLIQGQIVKIHGWMTMSEFTDLITISQMTPGPIAVNSATFVGLRVAGYAGAAVATFGCILPSCIIVTVIVRLYLKYRKQDVLQEILGGIRPAVVAMIASAGVSIFVTAVWTGIDMISLAGTKWNLVVIFAVSVVLLRKFKLNPVWVMLLSGAMQVLCEVGTFLLS